MNTFKATGECLSVTFDDPEGDDEEVQFHPDMELIRRVYKVPGGCEDVEAFVLNTISIKGV